MVFEGLGPYWAAPERVGRPAPRGRRACDGASAPRRRAAAGADGPRDPAAGIMHSLIYFSFRGEGVSLHELLIALFLFITAPVSAHMLAKAAFQQKLRISEQTGGKPWEQ